MRTQPAGRLQVSTDWLYFSCNIIPRRSRGVRKKQAETTDDLEKEKLRLEIQELQKPIWRKTSILAIVGPTLLAGGSLLLGLYTGLFNAQNERFNAQNERLRNETALLGLQKIKLNDEIVVLRTDVEREKKAVAQEKQDINRQLAEEKARLQATLETERTKINAELEPLRGKLASVNADIEKKNRELAELPVNTLIDQMASDRSLNAFNQGSQSLIALLMKEKEKVALLDERLKKDVEPALKANILYVIYKATGDAGRLKALFDFIASRPASDEPRLRMWILIGTGRWEANELPEVMKYIAANAGRLGGDEAGQALQIFQNPQLLPADAKKVLTTDNQLTLFLLGRRVALATAIYRISRGYGALTAGYFVPQAFPILIGAMLLNPEQQDGDKDYFRELIRESRYPWLEARVEQIKALDELKFPSDANNGLVKWKDDAAVKKWTAAILDDDPAKLFKK